MWKKVLLIVFLVFLIIQFFRPEKNLAAKDQPQALQKKYVLPEQVATTLQAACNDCHSNNTRYPWYAEVQPVAWYLAYHVEEGRQELNFDEFLSYPAKKQDHKMEEVVEMIEKGEMPLNSYTLLHHDAKLDPAQKAALIAWAKEVRAQVGYQPEPNQQEPNQQDPNQPVPNQPDKQK
ncbi:MAG: heme-binding domain-containing protein [Adhaeribacter sp.]